ncbi:glycosyl hydrolase [Streptomyces sp. NPDC047072]|uniref:glycosyl hydrolase n=1 Tax=Streptomyces sp. NPDC047072 TaxID=3154809 RepID=UPI0033D3BC98
MRRLRRRTQLLLALLMVIVGVSGTAAAVQWSRSDNTSISSKNAADATAGDHTVTFENRTGGTIWIGATVNADGSAALTGLPKLEDGQSATVTIPEHEGAGHWRGKFFARQGCTGTSGADFKCAVGDCGNYEDRCVAGDQPTSLAEFNFDPSDALAPWYNVSYVNAVSVPVTITPNDIPVPESGSCSAMGCAVDLLSSCPADNLQKDASGKPLVCVNPNRDAKTPYSDAINAKCQTAYAWSKQDAEPGNRTVAQCTQCTGMTVAFGTGALSDSQPEQTTGPTATPEPTPTNTATTKRGLSLNPVDGDSQALTDSGVSWYYNWDSSTGPTVKPANAEYVPMIWGAQGVNDTNLTNARNEGKALLGFNEPDLGSQANMSVEQALDLWPRLQDTGLRLGAPSVAFGGDVAGGWLDRFMAGAQQRGLRVDFIPLHWYGSDFGPDAANQLRDYLQKVYDRYHKPIWLTEYALIDYTGANPRYPSEQEQTDFIRSSTQMLNGLDFVERYAWFTLSTQTNQQTGLYTGATPNASGQIYKQAG